MKMKLQIRRVGVAEVEVVMIAAVPLLPGVRARAIPRVAERRRRVREARFVDEEIHVARRAHRGSSVEPLGEERALQDDTDEACAGERRVDTPEDLEVRAMIELATKVAWLHDIYVEPAVRTSGVGHELLHAVRTEATRWGANKVLLSVALNNPSGRIFFERTGFRTTMLEMMLEIDNNNG